MANFMGLQIYYSYDNWSCILVILYPKQTDTFLRKFNFSPLEKRQKYNQPRSQGREEGRPRGRHWN